MDETAGDLPVRDVGMMRGGLMPTIPPQRLFRFPREHLEDLCLRLQEENSVLRQHTRTQEQRLRMSTRLMRLRQARPGSSGVKDRDMEDTIQELEACVAMLESQKGVLQNKLSLAKQHIMDLKSMEVEGAVRRAAQTAPPRYGPMMEDSRAEMERRSSLTEQVRVAELELTTQALRDTLREKEKEIEGTAREMRKHQSDRHITIRENMDLIRLQKQLSDKSTALRVTQQKFKDLQEAYENQLEESQSSLRESQGALLEKVEELTEQLKQERQRALALEGQLTSATLSLQTLDKLQERISDLEGERDLIKENYDTLLEDKREHLEREVLQYREQVSALQDRLDSVTKEFDMSVEELSETLVQIKAFRMQQESREGLRFLWADGKVEDAPRELVNIQASHAEAVLELQKTRNLLLLEHRISKDLQEELNTVSQRMEREREESRRRMAEKDKLLSKRALQINTLQYLLFLLLQGATFTPAGLRIMGRIRAGVDSGEDIVTFCTYSLLDFEVHSTPLVSGSQPNYGFTSRYALTARDLGKLGGQGSRVRVELHQAVGGVRFVTHGSGQMSLMGAMERRGEHIAGRVSITQELHDYGRGIPNELAVMLERCVGLNARWPGLLPDAYLTYRFYDLPPHVSQTVQCTADPVFNDSTSYPLAVTADVLHYLRYVDYVLRDPAGGPRGMVRVLIKWKYPFQPPGDDLLGRQGRQDRPTESTEREERSRKEAEVSQRPIAKPRGDKLRVEILSLTFEPSSHVALDESVQRVYVEYRLLGIPMETTETPMSLRKPTEGEEVHYNFTRIYVDSSRSAPLRQYLYTMLEGTDPNQGLKFTVVSEPMDDDEECVDVGHAFLDLQELLLTGNDVIEQQIDMSMDEDKEVIGNLKVSLEAAKALTGIYQEFHQKTEIKKEDKTDEEEEEEEEEKEEEDQGEEKKKEVIDYDDDSDFY
uniref:Protein fantom-like n=1 Tax=Seriola dumerili TaxID=41447 RepID=A0A3B4VGV3_SERDU